MITLYPINRGDPKDGVMVVIKDPPTIAKTVSPLDSSLACSICLIVLADVAFLGWLLYIGYCAEGGFIVRSGGGVHGWDVPLRTREKNLYVCIT